MSDSFVYDQRILPSIAQRHQSDVPSLCSGGRFSVRPWAELEWRSSLRSPKVGGQMSWRVAERAWSSNQMGELDKGRRQSTVDAERDYFSHSSS
jgi:hypothetical protein